jgi:exodeoxyribonuclease VII small subunit
MNEQLSFEESMKELETIVRQLEQGGQTLEDSIKLYERGVLLRTLCEKRLNEAKMKIEQITGQLADGNVMVEKL